MTPSSSRGRSARPTGGETPSAGAADRLGSRPRLRQRWPGAGRGAACGCPSSAASAPRRRAGGCSWSV